MNEAWTQLQEAALQRATQLPIDIVEVSQVQ